MRLRVYSTEIRMADNRALMQEGSVHAQSAQAITTISRRVVLVGQKATF